MLLMGRSREGRDVVLGVVVGVFPAKCVHRENYDFDFVFSLVFSNKLFRGDC